MLRNEQSIVAVNDREIEIDALALFPSEWPSARAADPVSELTLFLADQPTVPDRQHDHRAGARRAPERRKTSHWLAQLSCWFDWMKSTSH